MADRPSAATSDVDDADDVDMTEDVETKQDGSQSGAGSTAADEPPPPAVTPELLAELGLTADRLEVATQVIETLAKNIHVFRAKTCKRLRQVMHPLVEEQSRRFYQGRDPLEVQRELLEMKDKHARKRKHLARDRQQQDRTRLRAERLAKLQNLLTQGDVPLIPDGAVGADPLLLEDAKVNEGSTQLMLSRLCYTCKGAFTELHHFYHNLCPPCASLNFSKRELMADLSDRVALVTGARVKIGYHCALKLLRCGAFVIATTRFPVDAARRFAKEPDFGAWRQRLHVYGMDFRLMTVVEHFTSVMERLYPRLDIIINNACQTVRRPPAYYKRLVAAERVPFSKLEEAIKPLLAPHFQYMATAGSHETEMPALSILDAAAPHDASGAAPSVGVEPADGDTTDAADIAQPAEPVDSAVSAAVTNRGVGSVSAEASQMCVVPGDREDNPVLFPPSVSDVNNQQVDLRRVNSWVLRLHQVSTSEVAEVLIINTMAPFVLNAKLKAMMMRTGAGVAKFIVNVSAMEGKFYRNKTVNHPHTNMAKAALNMMTRTSAADYAADKIYMNSVDTGWINDENPLETAAATAVNNHFQTPLDEIDAASRVLDPVISSVKAILEAEAAGQRPPVPVHGEFLKDYAISEW